MHDLKPPNVPVLINFSYPCQTAYVMYNSVEWSGNECFAMKFTFVCAYGRIEKRLKYLKLKLVISYTRRT